MPAMSTGVKLGMALGALLTVIGIIVQSDVKDKDNFSGYAMIAAGVTILFISGLCHYGPLYRRNQQGFFAHVDNVDTAGGSPNVILDIQTKTPETSLAADSAAPTTPTASAPAPAS